MDLYFVLLSLILNNKVRFVAFILLLFIDYLLQVGSIFRLTSIPQLDFFQFTQNIQSEQTFQKAVQYIIYINAGISVIIVSLFTYLSLIINTRKLAQESNIFSKVLSLMMIIQHHILIYPFIFGNIQGIQLFLNYQNGNLISTTALYVMVILAFFNLVCGLIGQLFVIRFFNIWIPGVEIPWAHNSFTIEYLNLLLKYYLVIDQCFYDSITSSLAGEISNLAVIFVILIFKQVQLMRESTYMGSSLQNTHIFLNSILYNIIFIFLINQAFQNNFIRTLVTLVFALCLVGYTSIHISQLIKNQLLKRLALQDDSFSADAANTALIYCTQILARYSSKDAILLQKLRNEHKDWCTNSECPCQSGSSGDLLGQQQVIDDFNQEINAVVEEHEQDPLANNKLESDSQSASYAYIRESELTLEPSAAGAVINLLLNTIFEMKGAFLNLENDKNTSDQQLLQARKQQNNKLICHIFKELHNKFKDSQQIGLLYIYFVQAIVKNSYIALFEQFQKSIQHFSKIDGIIFKCHEQYILNKIEKDKSQQFNKQKLDITEVVLSYQLHASLDKLVEDITSKSIKFWSLMPDLNPNMQLVYNTGVSISRKIHKFRKESGKLKQDTYLFEPQKLYFYSLFYSNVLHDFQSANTYILILKNHVFFVNINSKDKKNHMGQNDIGYMIAKCSTKARNQIEFQFCNSIASKILKISQSQFCNKDIMEIMPTVIRNQHTEFVKSFYENGNVRQLGHNNVQFLKSFDNYILPVELYVNIYFSYLYQYSFIVRIQKAATLNIMLSESIPLDNKNTVFFLCDGNYRILEHSENAINLFGLSDELRLIINDQWGRELKMTDLFLDLSSLPADSNAQIYNKKVIAQKLIIVPQKNDRLVSRSSIPCLFTYFKQTQGQKNCIDYIFLLSPVIDNQHMLLQAEQLPMTAEMSIGLPMLTETQESSLYEETFGSISSQSSSTLQKNDVNFSKQLLFNENVPNIIKFNLQFIVIVFVCYMVITSVNFQQFLGLSTIIEMEMNSYYSYNGMVSDVAQIVMPLKMLQIIAHNSSLDQSLVFNQSRTQFYFDTITKQYDLFVQDYQNFLSYQQVFQHTSGSSINMSAIDLYGNFYGLNYSINQAIYLLQAHISEINTTEVLSPAIPLNVNLNFTQIFSDPGNDPNYIDSFQNLYFIYNNSIEMMSYQLSKQQASIITYISSLVDYNASYLNTITYISLAIIVVIAILMYPFVIIITTKKYSVLQFMSSLEKVHLDAHLETIKIFYQGFLNKSEMIKGKNNVNSPGNKQYNKSGNNKQMGYQNSSLVSSSKATEPAKKNAVDQVSSKHLSATGDQDSEHIHQSKKYKSKKQSRIDIEEEFKTNENQEGGGEDFYDLKKTIKKPSRQDRYLKKQQKQTQQFYKLESEVPLQNDANNKQELTNQQNEKKMMQDDYKLKQQAEFRTFNIRKSIIQLMNKEKISVAIIIMTIMVFFNSCLIINYFLLSYMTSLNISAVAFFNQICLRDQCLLILGINAFEPYIQNKSFYFDGSDTTSTVNLILKQCRDVENTYQDLKEAPPTYLLSEQQRFNDMDSNLMCGLIYIGNQTQINECMTSYNGFLAQGLQNAVFEFLNYIQVYILKFESATNRTQEYLNTQIFDPTMSAYQDAMIYYVVSIISNLQDYLLPNIIGYFGQITNYYTYVYGIYMCISAGLLIIMIIIFVRKIKVQLLDSKNMLVLLPFQNANENVLKQLEAFISS